MSEFRLRDTIRPDVAPYIVAEIGINFNGSRDLAIATIDAAIEAGVDAVKFQTFKTDEFMADYELKYDYIDREGSQSLSMYEMFKKYELPDEWHMELRDYARGKGVDFISSSSDKAGVDLLCSLGVPALKFASEDLINIPLLEYAAKKQYPSILSTGMANTREIDSAVDIFRAYNCPYMLMHCVSLYPTPHKYANIARIYSLHERYRVPIGYSDHTEGITASVLSLGYGAMMIEKHFTLSKDLEGPDHIFSADPQEMAALVHALNTAALQCGDGKIQFQEQEVISRRHFRRSIVAQRDIQPGEAIDETMLCLKRPGTGLHPHELSKLLHKRVKRVIRKNMQILWSDIDES